MTVRIELAEADFVEVASADQRSALVGTVRVLDRQEEARSPVAMIEDLLPAAIVQRIRKITPPDFILAEISIDAEVSGKVFGTGVSGTFSMKLVRAKGR